MDMDMEPEAQYRVTIAELVTARQDLAARIDRLKEEYEKGVKPHLEMLKSLEAQICEAMDREGLTNVKTPGGTVYFSNLEKFFMVDRENFYQWLDKTKAWGVLTAHVSAEGIRERGEIPAGVEVTYTRQLRIRKS